MLTNNQTFMNVQAEWYNSVTWTSYNVQYTLYDLLNKMWFEM